MSIFRTLKFIVEHPLNKGRKAKALLGFLRWQIGSRLVPGEVVYPWINEAKFIVRPGEAALTQNIYCGLFEFQEMAYVLHVLNSEDVFIDVGANVGSYTILACAVKKARGYCFEPIPATFQRLMNNIRLNNLLDRVTAYNMGLADREGELLFTSGRDSTNHVVAEGEVVADAIRVKVASLDAVLAGVSPSLIKIDVEGFEAQVVNGMLHILETPSLHSVIMELSDGSRYGLSSEIVKKKMFDLGFGMYTYEPFSRRLIPALHGNRSQNGNVLFLRDVDSINSCLAGAPRFLFGSRYV
jgi:FkbM family methyltransferase